MVVMFGETDWDKRGYTFGLAGFLAGVHALRILAERGIASAEDISVSLDGIRATLRNVPRGMISDAQLEGIEDMLAGIHAAALRAEPGSDG
jgi:hypothetical protein